MNASRKRRAFQSTTRPNMTVEERRVQKSQSAAFEARLDGVVDFINRQTKEIAKEFSKTPAYVRGRMYAGSKGAAFLRRSRATNNVRVYDAYMHWKCKRIHEDEERTSPLSLDELRTIVRSEEPHYSTRPSEEKDTWVEEYKADMKAKNTKRRVNRKAEQQDATCSFKHMASEIETLEMRTGVKGFYFGVRSDILQTIQPFFACTADVTQFFNIVLGKTPDQIISLFEMWSIGGLRGVFGINAKNSLELKADARRAIQVGLDKVLVERYGVGKAPALKMNYVSYDETIVAAHGVRLVGWTYEIITNPGYVKPVEELRKLYDALVAENCHWEVVPAEEREAPTTTKRKRKAKDTDADAAPSKRAKAAAAKKKKKRAPSPTSSSSPTSTDDESDED